MNEYLKCESCDKEDETVQTIECPFTKEIYGDSVMIDLCPDCFQDRVDDIQGVPMNDPVYRYIDGTWYFWDETWSFAHGPYDTEQLARKACIEYARRLDD